MDKLNKGLRNLSNKYIKENKHRKHIVTLVVLCISILNMVVAMIVTSLLLYCYGTQSLGFSYAGCIAAFVLGLLIISSIFEMILSSDFDFYRVLVKIGLTEKELKCFIRNQFIRICVIGVLAGIFFGGILGSYALSIVYDSTKYGEMNILLLVACATCASLILTCITIYLGILLPISKIDSFICKEKDVELHGDRKKRKSGGKLFRMAWSNVVRDKGKLGAIVGLISFALIIMNTLFTISVADDTEERVNSALSVDFMLTPYHTYDDRIREKGEFVSETYLNSVLSTGLVSEGGLIYHNLDYLNVALRTDKEITKSEFYGWKMPCDEKGGYFFNFYGAEDFVLSQLDIVEGKLDFEKLSTGNYIIYGLGCEDYGTAPDEKWDYFDIGDKIEITYKGKSKEYEILAKCAVRPTTSEEFYGSCIGSELTFYLPAEEYLKNMDDSEPMRYIFNVEDNNIDKMEEYLSRYTENAEGNVQYESRKTWEENYVQDENIIKNVGILLCLLIGSVGVINYVNMIVISAVVRKKEFALLECIGMTKGQINKMIMLEGVYYVLLILFLAVGGATLLSLLFKYLIGSSWGWNYKYVIFPVTIALPVIIFVSIFVPVIIFGKYNKQSIVKRIANEE